MNCPVALVGREGWGPVGTGVARTFAWEWLLMLLMFIEVMMLASSRDKTGPVGGDGGGGMG